VARFTLAQQVEAVPHGAHGDDGQAAWAREERLVGVSRRGHDVPRQNPASLAKHVSAQRVALVPGSCETHSAAATQSSDSATVQRNRSFIHTSFNCPMEMVAH